VEAVGAAAQQDDVAGGKHAALKVAFRFRVEVDLKLALLDQEDFLREVHLPRHLIVAMGRDALALGMAHKSELL
jgi:hypothetical protein